MPAHGSLNRKKILGDEPGNHRLIDSAKTRNQHILQDIVKREAVLRGGMGKTGSRETPRDLIRRDVPFIIAGTRLDSPYIPHPL